MVLNVVMFFYIFIMFVYLYMCMHIHTFTVCKGQRRCTIIPAHNDFLNRILLNIPIINLSTESRAFLPVERRPQSIWVHTSNIWKTETKSKHLHSRNKNKSYRGQVESQQLQTLSGGLMSLIPAPRAQKLEGHPRLHREFENELHYMRFVSTNQPKEPLCH